MCVCSLCNKFLVAFGWKRKHSRTRHTSDSRMSCGRAGRLTHTHTHTHPICCIVAQTPGPTLINMQIVNLARASFVLVRRRHATPHACLHTHVCCFMSNTPHNWGQPPDRKPRKRCCTFRGGARPSTNVRTCVLSRLLAVA